MNYRDKISDREVTDTLEEMLNYSNQSTRHPYTDKGKISGTLLRLLQLVDWCATWSPGPLGRRDGRLGADRKKVDEKVYSHSRENQTHDTIHNGENLVKRHKDGTRYKEFPHL